MNDGHGCQVAVVGCIVCVSGILLLLLFFFFVKLIFLLGLCNGVGLVEL